MSCRAQRSGDARQLTGTYRERSRPAVTGFVVDEQAPNEPLSPRQWQRPEVDAERNPQFAPRSNSSRSAGFELAVQADRLVSDRHRMTVFIREIESPLMFDVCLIPRHCDSDRDGDVLRSRPDHSEAPAQNEEFAVVHLHGIGHQDDGSECWRVEGEVGLIHYLDPIGPVHTTGDLR